MTGPALILVRHAAPKIEPDVPPPQWRLSDEGRLAAEALSLRIGAFRPVAVRASTEPKAIETAQILAAPLGLAVTSDAAFDEHRREDWPFEPDAAVREAKVLRVLSEFAASVDGAEPGVVAAARFAGGLESHPQRPLVVVTHGTILALYMAWTASVEPKALWRSLHLPDALILDAQGQLIERLV
ncbi:MAG: histidine phosphatase family protein [Caulobacteraceae bacterium]|nr:histidine phosphatase family protein [Caulobacteraceae bacterium]